MLCWVHCYPVGVSGLSRTLAWCLSIHTPIAAGQGNLYKQHCHIWHVGVKGLPAALPLLLVSLHVSVCVLRACARGYVLLSAEGLSCLCAETQHSLPLGLCWGLAWPGWVFPVTSKASDGCDNLSDL